MNKFTKIMALVLVVLISAPMFAGHGGGGHGGHGGHGHGGHGYGGRGRGGWGRGGWGWGVGFYPGYYGGYYGDYYDEPVVVEQPVYVDQEVPAAAQHRANSWHITNKTGSPLTIESAADKIERLEPGKSANLYFAADRRIKIFSTHGEEVGHFTVQENNIDIEANAGGKIELSVW